jgi:hypothetical protein
MALRVGFQNDPGNAGAYVMTAMKVRDPIFARLDIRLEPRDGVELPAVSDPELPRWSVTAAYITDGERKSTTPVGKVGSGDLSFLNAISIAYEFLANRDFLWKKAAPIEAEYDLHEINPLAYKELRHREDNERRLASIEASLFEKPQDNPTNGSKTMTAEDSIRIAKEAGFDIWNTGGGCLAFAKLLKEVKTPRGDAASMDLMITKEGGTSINAAPDERVWGAGINYTDPRGGDSPRYTREDVLTLEEAIAVAAQFEREAEAVWAENYDAEAIAEYEGRFSM